MKQVSVWLKSSGYFTFSISYIYEQRLVTIFGKVYLFDVFYVLMSKLFSKFHVFDVFHVLMSTGHVIALIFRFCLETFHVVQIWISLMFMPTNYLICCHRIIKQNVEQSKHILEGKCSLWYECVLIATHNSLDIGLSSNIRHIFFSLNSIGCGTHSWSRSYLLCLVLNLTVQKRSLFLIFIIKVIFLKLPFKTSKSLNMFAPVVKYILQSQCFFKELRFPLGKNSCKVISSKMILSLKKKLPAIHLHSESCFPEV